jgi:hypothetical protein
LEVNLHTSNEDSLCKWWGFYTEVERKVCVLVETMIFSVLTTKGRYHQVPMFGHGTIRCFNENAAAMKKLAAQDFEDLLQVFSNDQGFAWHITHNIASVLFLCLRIYSRHATTQLSSTFSLSWGCGRHMLSFAFTQNAHLSLSNKQHWHWETWFDTLQRPVKHSEHMTCHTK